MKRTILVTGGSGHIGRMTIPILEDIGYNVINYDIQADEKDDIFDHARLTAAMEGTEAVYHLAAIPHPFKAMEHAYKRLNYDGAVGVFDCARMAGVKKFIFSSSGCVYGFWGGNAKPTQLPIAEENPIPGVEEGNTLYGYMKHAFEQYLLRRSEEEGISSVSLRLEGVGSHRTAEHVYLGYDDNGRIPVTTFVYQHFLACCARENYAQMLQLVLERSLYRSFEVFNVGNEFVDDSIDVQELIRKHWPTVPCYVSDNETLYSIEKSKRLLGYRPVC